MLASEGDSKETGFSSESGKLSECFQAMFYKIIKLKTPPLTLEGYGLWTPSPTRCTCVEQWHGKTYTRSYCTEPVALRSPVSLDLHSFRLPHCRRMRSSCRALFLLPCSSCSVNFLRIMYLHTELSCTPSSPCKELLKSHKETAPSCCFST